MSGWSRLVLQWIQHHNFTATQMMVMTWSVFLPCLYLTQKVSFLVIFGITMLLTTALLKSAGSINHVIADFYYSISRHLECDIEYRQVHAEIDLIREKIKLSYIMSWTSFIHMPSETVDVLLHGFDATVNNFLQTAQNQLDIRDCLQDVVAGVHVFIQRYHKAETKWAQQKRRSKKSQNYYETVDNLYLAESDNEWQSVHEKTIPEEYIKIVILNFLCPLYAVQLTTSTEEALVEIIHNNIIMNLINFLSEKENLIILGIKLLSENSEQLLEECELEEEHTDTRSAAQLNLTKESAGKNSSIREETSTADEVTFYSDDIEDVQGSPQENEPGDIGEYISDELSKFFKIVPTSGSAAAPNMETTKILPNSSTNTETPQVLPMSVLFPAASIQKADSAEWELGVLSSGTFSMSSSTTLEAAPMASSTTLSTEDECKFLTVTIPSSQLQEDRTQGQYTLYEIEYKAAYQLENGERIEKIRTVYRRFREFMNLVARLEKNDQFSKRLKKIPTPTRWQQISIRPLNSSEVIKRRLMLEQFLQALIEDTTIRYCADLDQFLAYSGGGELEFVKEIVDYIPPAIRLDKVVIRTVSGMLDRVVDKFSTAGTPSSSPDSRFSRNRTDVDFIEAKADCDQMEVIFDQDESLPVTLCNYNDSNQSRNMDNTARKQDNKIPILEQERHTSAAHKTSILTDEILELVLTCLQPHIPTSRNQSVVHFTQTLVRPYLNKWLQAKIDRYSSPSKLKHIVSLLRVTVWPERLIRQTKYDMVALQRTLLRLILSEVPLPIGTFIGTEISTIFHHLVTMTSEHQVVQTLIYRIINQLLSNSLYSLFNTPSSPVTVQ